MSVAAVIVAAGGSRRMGFDKLSVELGGVPVLARSIEAFEISDEIDHLVVVTTRARFSWLEEIGAARGWRKLNALVEGAEERHLSVFRGLEAVPDGTELVAVHDGARPLVTSEAIGRCVTAARADGAVALAHRVTDTLKRATEEGRVTESVSRDHLWAMETPQVFALGRLRSAYDQIIASGRLVTDEVSAMQESGEVVTLVENDAPNPKITYPADLALAEALLAR